MNGPGAGDQASHSHYKLNGTESEFPLSVELARDTFMAITFIQYYNDRSEESYPFREFR